MCDINSKINYTVDIDEANNFTEDISDSDFYKKY